MKVKDLVSVLPIVYGNIDLVSDSHDEALALSCSPEQIAREYGDKPVTGVEVRLVIRVP